MNQSNSKRILNLLNESARALDSFEIAERVGLDMRDVQSALNALAASGQVALTKKGKYALPETLGLVRARATALRNGTLLAEPLCGGESMRIRTSGFLRALPGDVILIRPDGEECDLIAIAERGLKTLPAFLFVRYRQMRVARNARKARREIPSQRILTATACDRRIAYPIEIANTDLPIQNDALALIAIDRYPEGDRPIYAHIERVLGDQSDVRARLSIIAEAHGFLPQTEEGEFPERIDDLSGREDLREVPIFTIDGAFSKDFDDAVSLSRDSAGKAVLGVHIADVSHYVRPGSELDQNAFARGTSLYLPGLTVPMLPEALSNDLCSLLPEHDRLTISVFLTVENGEITHSRICESVIRSCARLTYDGVNRFFGGDTSAVPESVHDILSDMRELARQLRTRRSALGALDLDVPEAEFTLDENSFPTELYCADRGESERLIESFMLAANEAVARIARENGLPLVYRVHESPDPDRLHALGAFLTQIGVPFHLSARPEPIELKRILDATRDHPVADAIRRTLLRSLQRARYDARPLGHYALAMEDYCHFTSPIRRYPDLVVHRQLKRLLRGQSAAGTKMPDIARQSSLREQESVLAEREADDLMKAFYMQDQIGRAFDAIVSGITGWGLYVTLENTVEGLVPISTLDDYYIFDRDRGLLIAENTRNVFHLGDRVRVRLDQVDIQRAEIAFVLLPPRRRQANA